LAHCDRTYTADEVDYVTIAIRNDASYTPLDYTVSAGYFGLCMAVDEGLTEYAISVSLKPIRRTFSISVVVPFNDFDKAYRRHLAMKGKIITLDGTDGVLNSLTARGIITDISHATVASNGRDIDTQYRYKMTFLEVV